MHKTIALALATGIAVATLPGISQSAPQSRSTPIFIANEHDEKENNERMRHQGGEHYDTVVGNYTRRCTSLDGQFKHLRARPGAGSREASALCPQGPMHDVCSAVLSGHAGVKA
jgi:hypothetical protein